jgi:hypothetical protein
MSPLAIVLLVPTLMYLLQRFIIQSIHIYYGDFNMEAKMKSSVWFKPCQLTSW